MRTFVANVERLAGFFLLGVALLTAATVTLRYLFSIQIPDWFDFAKLAQGVAIFWGIAAATYRNDHISVDILWEHANEPWRRRLDIAATLFVAAALAVFAWMVVSKVFDTAATGQVTTDLRLSLWPFYGVAAFGVVAAFALALIRLWHLARGDAPEAMDRDMDKDLIALAGFIAMFVLMAIRVPIGLSMAIPGVIGFGMLTGLKPALELVARVPLSVVTDYNFSVIPMFVLMGALASHAGMSRELFNAGNAWFGHLRGGLGIAAISACGGFACINGSSVATAATMTQVVLPEMRRSGYDAGLSAGLIAAGGTLGIMIPPSVILVLYGIMTETDTARLFAAGVIPGLLAILLYSLVVQWIAWRHPELMPRGKVHGWDERWESIRGLWAVLLLFASVLIGMYLGVFTVTEGAGVGAVGALAIGILKGGLKPRDIMNALVGSLRVSASIMLIVIGAFLFGYFLTITQFTQKAVDLLVNLPIGAYGVLALVMVGYLILGAVMDELAMILLTVPIVYPAMLQLGFDPIWFGIMVVMAVTFGMICPPVGMNVFVINSIARDVPLTRIYMGTMPFIGIDVVRLVILAAFPAMVLWLPNQMG